MSPARESWGRIWNGAGHGKQSEEGFVWVASLSSSSSCSLFVDSFYFLSVEIRKTDMENERLLTNYLESTIHFVGCLMEGGLRVATVVGQRHGEDLNPYTLYQYK